MTFPYVHYPFEARKSNPIPSSRAYTTAEKNTIVVATNEVPNRDLIIR